MKNPLHRRVATSDQINLPIITTKQLKHPKISKTQINCLQQNKFAPAKITNINSGTVPSTSTSISRHSLQKSFKQNINKQNSLLSGQKSVPFRENKTIINVIKNNNNNNKQSICSNKVKGKKIVIENKKENINIEQELNDPYPQFQLKTENKLKHPDLEFLFKKEPKIGITPYHKDCDMNMYTKEALTERKNLKDLVNVKIAINRFIEDCFEFDKFQQLTKMNYLQAFFKISLILRDDLVEENQQDFKELKLIMEDDWNHDSKGKNKMNRNDLEDALFELADIWTPGINASQYISFFETLRFKFACENSKPKVNFYDVYN